MKINIKDAPSRSETIIRNIVYSVRATAIMTEYYLRSFPVVFFYVLIGFALAFDSTEVPLTTLLQQGMLTSILTCSVTIDTDTYVSGNKGMSKEIFFIDENWDLFIHAEDHIIPAQIESKFTIVTGNGI